MPEARFRFYAELNDFLPPERRFTEFPYRFLDIATIKDRIESFGVPHTEVDLILVNGESVDFAYRVRDGDRVSVYPVFEALDVSGVTRLRPEPLRTPRFVLDAHLGRLATYLRMLGFDSLYRNSYTDEQLAAVSAREERILLTRDLGLLKRSAVTHGSFIRETEARRQTVEVVKRFHLERLARPFSRCLRCNALLEDRDKAEVLDRLPVQTAALHDEFRNCPECGRVFWKGSHYRRMQQWLESCGLY